MEYYAQPRRATGQTSLTSNISQSEHLNLTIDVGDDTLAAAFERSIYLFPNPLSAPPSPTPLFPRASTSASSSDFFVSRERSLTQTSSASGSEWEDVGTPLSFRPSDAGSPFPSSSELGQERAGWDWSPLDEVEASMLEEEIARASRWDMAAALRRRVDSLADAEARQQQFRGLTQSKTSSDVRLDARRPSYVRSRTTSAATSYGPGSSPGSTPHPRIHLPLLSFFASFLSLDSATVHLLQHTPTHSVLFPGASSSISSDIPEAGVNSDHPHGIESLFTPPSEMSSLKEGTKVACDEDITPSNPFLVSPVALASIVEMVKGMIWRGERWRRLVWGSDHSTDD